ncbi:MAG: hypothetical protein MRY74_07090 [Neomegalonema sp.]|nr:hypothetical protein [Neomegalonema sp.]
MMGSLTKGPSLAPRACCAALALASFLAPVARAQEALHDLYAQELKPKPQEWVVIGHHFRHSDNCTSDGCVVMGPMDDREACEEWARDYNRHDPYDHTRCVEAKDYRTKAE